MKKLLIVLLPLLLPLLFLMSCNIETVKEQIDTETEIIIINGCEYEFFTGGNLGFLAHKGNCKQCQKRYRDIIIRIKKYKERLIKEMESLTKDEIKK